MALVVEQGAARRSLDPLREPLRRIADRQFAIGIIGLGYVGIPLALTACKAGFPVIGFDINRRRVEELNRGESVLKHIPTEPIRDALREGRFHATADWDELAKPDALLIAVPT